MKQFVWLTLFVVWPSWAFAENVLTWVNGQVYTQVEVERAANMTSPYTKIDTLDGSPTTYNDPAGVVHQCYRVRGMVNAVPSGYSNADCKEPAVIATPPPAPSMPVLAWVETQPPTQPTGAINFQPAATAPVPGYSIDDGSPYSSARKYGWDTDRKGHARTRGMQADKRLDSLLYVDAGQTALWTYDLPNGSYLVSLAVGDAAWAQGPHRVEVEGVVVIDNVATGPNQFVTKTDIPVTVSDGKLTIKLGGPGAGNTMLNYVEVKQ